MHWNDRVGWRWDKQILKDILITINFGVESVQPGIVVLSLV